MSQAGYALRRKELMTKGVAAVLALALVTTIGLTAGSLTKPGEEDRGAQGAAEEAVDPGSAKPSEILAATTASPALDTAISALVSAERFRFELFMKPVASGSTTSWRVTGEADIATSIDDPPRLHAQVAIGSGDAYSVISEQVRVGEALYNRDAESGVFERGSPAGSEELGAVDPVTTILSSLRELPASQFQETTLASGARAILVRAGDHDIEGGITSMRIVVDAATGAISSMSFRSEAMTSRIVVTDLGDPSIEIQAPR